MEIKIKNIIFIDSRVEDFEALVANLGADTHWHILDTNQEGLVQMQQILADYLQLDSIQIVSHGSTGTLYLGSTILNGNNLSSYESQLQQIGASLTETGDILLYGCNVAKGDEGISFINLLAQMTGADVAASDDLSGSAVMGADSVLESSTAAVETESLNLESLSDVLVVNNAPTLDGDAYKIEVINEGYINSGAINVAIQPDGKFILVGNGLNESTLNTDVILTRLNTDGSLDTTFGLNGITSADWGGDDASRMVKLQSDGKILVAGISDSIFTIARYDTDGLPDTSFGSNGVVQYDLFTYGNHGRSHEITLQDDGKILITANTGPDLGGEFLLLRLNQDGSQDSSFANNGTLTSNLLGAGWLGYPVVTTSDGKIFVGGDAGVSLIKYNIDGSIDTSFADNGILVDSNVSASITAIQILNDGSILVAGIAGVNPGYINDDVFLARYDVNGVLDTSFGQNGYVTKDIGGWEHVDDLLIGPDGNIYVYGATNTDPEYTGSGYRFVISYNADGSINPQFGLDGIVELTNWNEGIAIQPDGKLLIPNSKNGHLAIERLNVDGSKDITFDGAVDTNSFAGYINEDGSVSTLPFSIFADLVGAIDADGDSIGVVITSLQALENDAFEYSTDNGDTWHLIDGGVISETNAQVFSGSDVFRYTPQTNSNGIHQFTFRAWDGGGGYSTGDFVNLTVTGLGGSSPFSAAIATHTLNIIPVEDEATGTLSVSGTAEEGGSVIAALTNVLDADGATSTAYQWQENTGTSFNPEWIDIADQDAATLNIPDDQSYVGKVVRVVATTTDTLGGTTTFTSDAQTIANADDEATGTNDTPEITLGTNDESSQISSYDFSEFVSISLFQNQTGFLVSGFSDDEGQAVLASFNMDGSLNSSFNNGEPITYNYQGFATLFTSAAIDINGRVIVAATTNGGSLVLCYKPDGTIDTTFGNNGIAQIIDGAINNIALDDSGNIYITTSGFASPVTCLKLDSNGFVDINFGDSGYLDLSPINFGYIGSLSINGNSLFVTGGNNSYQLAKYHLSDGSLDTSFNGGTGYVSQVINSGLYIGGIGGALGGAGAAIFQSDGKIVLIGNAPDETGSNTDITLVRFNTNGTLDTSFGLDGIVQYGELAINETPTTSGYQTGFTQGLDGSIYVAANANGNCVLVKFTADGVLDANFTSNASQDMPAIFMQGEVPYYGYIGYFLFTEPDGSIGLQGRGSTYFARFDTDGNLLQTALQGSGDLLGVFPFITETDAIISASGTLTVVDADLSDTVTVTVESVATGGTFAGSNPLSNAALKAMLTVTTGAIAADTGTTNNLSWDFSSGAASDFDFLGTGETLVLTYTLKAEDSAAAIANDTQTVTVTIIGTNDTQLGNVNITGTPNVDTLTGGLLDDTLTGLGGIDILDGGEGSDLYIMRLASDHPAAEINDTGENGTDEVRFTSTKAKQTLTLFAGDRGIEKVTIGTGTATEAVRTGTTALNVNAAAAPNGLYILGNNGNNTLTGTAFNDTLDGSLCVDRLIGGAGDDTYIVDLNANGTLQDKIVELAGANGGTDTLQLRGAYTNTSKAATLRLATNLENLDASAVNGSGKLNLTGNQENNILTGNDTDNILNGLAGADTMAGGAGNDTYVVDNALDVVTEELNEGTDLVLVAITVANGTYTLTDNVENGTLINKVAFNLTGNDLDNILTGNAAANTLNGGDGDDRLIGGLGNDTLTGGAGSDTFVFNTKLNARKNLDIITDFESGTDKIELAKSIMTRLGSLGELTEAQFKIGAAASESSHRIIYNETTGGLFYDADGSGKGAAVQIALLGVNTDLTHDDIFIV